MKHACPFTVGIVGLGLIGGSMARAYAEAGHTVLALDRDEATLSQAMADGVARAVLSPETAPACHLLLLAVYPQSAVTALAELAPYIKPSCTVIDCCGTKRDVVRECSAIAREHGFSYLGGHPMAGTQFSGYASSHAALFCGAPMVLVPTDGNERATERAKELLSPLGFGSFAVTDACHHDRIIAFTSQLAHVVSNAYVKSPRAQAHHGFSAGSYRDLTRVAWLNEAMWSELFLENRDFLSEEIDLLITHLSAYKTALDEGDREALTLLLREGRLAKERADKDKGIL